MKPKYVQLDLILANMVVKTIIDILLFLSKIEFQLICGIERYPLELFVQVLTLVITILLNKC